MPDFRPEDCPILFNDGPHNRTSRLAKTITCINRDDLFNEYKRMRECAPRRSERGKRYFVGHKGVITSKSEAGNSNRGEELLAIAIWSLKEHWPCPGGGRFRLLDYQVPLKAKRSDRRIGKVDLLGLTVRGRLIIIELKVKPRNAGSRGDTPLLALMEGLRYAAIFEANRDVIAMEAKHLFKEDITNEPPIVQILAPRAWWKGWLDMGGSTRKAAGEWEPAFARLTSDIEEGRIGVPIECMALDDFGDGDIAFGVDCKTPTLGHAPKFRPVRPGDEPPIADALL